MSATKTTKGRVVEGGDQWLVGRYRRAFIFRNVPAWSSSNALKVYLRPQARVPVVDWRIESPHGPPHKLPRENVLHEMPDTPWRTSTTSCRISISWSSRCRRGDDRLG